MKVKHLYSLAGVTIFGLAFVTFVKNWDFASETSQDYQVYLGKKPFGGNHERAKFDIELSQLRDKQHQADEIVILYWKKPWNQENAWPPEGHKYKNCLMTYDQNRLREAKAVIFHYSIAVPRELPWQNYR